MRGRKERENVTRWVHRVEGVAGLVKGLLFNVTIGL